LSAGGAEGGRLRLQVVQEIVECASGAGEKGEESSRRPMTILGESDQTTTGCWFRPKAAYRAVPQNHQESTV
jgi:hypothetical protein